MIDLNVHFLYTDHGQLAERSPDVKKWILAIVTIICMACSTPDPAASTPVVEVAISELPVEPTATPACLHRPGVIAEIEQIKDYSVMLHIAGLQPGEIPFVTYSTTSASGNEKLYGTSGNFVKGADEGGQFSFSLPGLRPLDDEASAAWDIRVIHARGVECAQVTLP